MRCHAGAPSRSWLAFYRRKAPAAKVFAGGRHCQNENFDKNLERVGEIGRLAAEKGVTPARLALAWVLAQGHDLVPIPGTRRRSYLDKNVAALDVKLSPEDLARIDQVVPPGVDADTSYAAPQMLHLGR